MSQGASLSLPRLWGFAQPGDIHQLVEVPTNKLITFGGQLISLYLNFSGCFQQGAKWCCFLEIWCWARDQLCKAASLEPRMKAARLTHSLVTQSSCVCSADKVSANTLTVVVPLWPHMQLNMTPQIPGCTNWQVKLTPIKKARTDAQPCKISHVPVHTAGCLF